MLFNVLLTSVNIIVVHCISFANRSSMDASKIRPTFDKYQELRKNLLTEHLGKALGSDIILNEREEQLNSIIMDLKADELSRGFQNPFTFTPARHFFDVAKALEATPLFKIIKKMPKGWFPFKIF